MSTQSEIELVERYERMVKRIRSELNGLESLPVLHYLPEHPHTARIELFELLKHRMRQMPAVSSRLDQSGDPEMISRVLEATAHLASVGQIIQDLDALMQDAGGYRELRDKVLAAAA